MILGQLLIGASLLPVLHPGPQFFPTVPKRDPYTISVSMLPDREGVRCKITNQAREPLVFTRYRWSYTVELVVNGAKLTDHDEFRRRYFLRRPTAAEWVKLFQHESIEFNLGFVGGDGSVQAPKGKGALVSIVYLALEADDPPKDIAERGMTVLRSFSLKHLRL